MGLDHLNKMMEQFSKPVKPALIGNSGNKAAWMYERLARMINDFEKELDQEHEIGARLVSFGQTLIFHISDLARVS